MIVAAAVLLVLPLGFFGPVIIVGGKIQGSGVIDAKGRVPDGKEPFNPADLGEIILLIVLVGTIQQTEGQGGIQASILLLF